MFTAYVDESGTHDKSPFVAVGGVIASAEQWAEFERRWQQSLADFGVPYSHMKEFTQSVGVFKIWKSKTNEFEPERRAFLKRLCDCMVANISYSFGAILTRKHYAELVPQDLRVEMGTPYTFLGRYCIARVGVWAQDNSPDKAINLVFERGQPETTLKFQHKILTANENARKEYSLGLLSFADKYNKPVHKTPWSRYKPLIWWPMKY